MLTYAIRGLYYSASRARLRYATTGRLGWHELFEAAMFGIATASVIAIYTHNLDTAPLRDAEREITAAQSATLDAQSAEKHVSNAQSILDDYQSTHHESRFDDIQKDLAKENDGLDILVASSAKPGTPEFGAAQAPIQTAISKTEDDIKDLNTDDSLRDFGIAMLGGILPAFLGIVSIDNKLHKRR